MDLNNLVNRVIVPTLTRCARCHKGKDEHALADRKFKQDESLPKWHGWHATRRGMGTNLYRLGVPEKTIQAILRHANVSAMATYYIKTRCRRRTSCDGKTRIQAYWATNGQRTWPRHRTPRSREHP
jgi:integrase